MLYISASRIEYSGEVKLCLQSSSANRNSTNSINRPTVTTYKRSLHHQTHPPQHEPTVQSSNHEQRIWKRRHRARWSRASMMGAAGSLVKRSSGALRAPRPYHGLLGIFEKMESFACARFDFACTVEIARLVDCKWDRLRKIVKPRVKSVGRAGMRCSCCYACRSWAFIMPAPALRFSFWFKDLRHSMHFIFLWKPPLIIFLFVDFYCILQHFFL